MIEFGTLIKRITLINNELIAQICSVVLYVEIVQIQKKGVWLQKVPLKKKKSYHLCIAIIHLPTTQAYTFSKKYTMNHIAGDYSSCNHRRIMTAIAKGMLRYLSYYLLQTVASLS